MIGMSGCGGADGLPGKDGIDGANGPSVTQVVRCGKMSGGFYFAYQTITYSTGDKLIGCEVSGGAVQSYESIYYRASQAGSVIEGCLVTYDVDAASGGFWNFSANTGRKALYVDSPSASNGSAVTFGSSDCTTL